MFSSATVASHYGNYNTQNYFTGIVCANTDIIRTRHQLWGFCSVLFKYKVKYKGTGSLTDVLPCAATQSSVPAADTVHGGSSLWMQRFRLQVAGEQCTDKRCTFTRMQQRAIAELLIKFGRNVTHSREMQ